MTSSQESGAPWPRRLLRVIAVVLLVVSMLGLLSREMTVPVEAIIVLACLGPLLVVPAAASLVLFIRVRSSLGVSAAGLTLLLVIASQAPLYRSSAPVSPQGRTATIAVMTANLNLGRADASRLVAKVREQGISVLAVQEVTDDALARLQRAGVDAALPYRVLAPHEGAAGVALWSAYPLSDYLVETVGPMRRIWAWTVLDPMRPGRITVLASLHVVSPWPASGSSWSADLEGLGSRLRSVGDQVIALGDFNATWDHAQFRALLTNGYVDAGAASGSGWQPTFPAGAVVPPVIRIDHVVVRGLAVIASRSVGIAGSDHLGFIAVLADPTRHHL